MNFTLMRTRSLSDSSISLLFMIACLLLATATVILYSNNLEYKKINKELLIQNESINSLNTELNATINNQIQKKDNQPQN